MAFFLTELFILLIVVGLFLVLSAVWPPDSPWAPWWQMPDGVIKKMCQLANIKKNDVIYDLGCGTGKALTYASKIYGVKGVGIEIDPIRVLFAKWNVKRAQVPVTILKKNFFNVPLTNATILFIYLVPIALKRLTPKFLKELQPGTTFVSYVYPMPVELYQKRLKLLKHDTKNRIFIYQLLAKSQQ